MVDLNTLNQKARSAAMRGGTSEWGQWGNVYQHIRYAQPVESRSRKRCTCGCGKRGTHRGFCNGVAMTSPRCELAVARWVKTGE